MCLTLKDVNHSNWRDVAALRVAEEQVPFIESNSYSIAQSMFEPNWKMVALYDGELLVGFAMYGVSKEDQSVWLDRFMIDVSFQGKGYAKRFVEIIINQIKKIYQCDELYLSVVMENNAAISLYEKVGFKFTGEIDDTEVIIGNVMKLELNNYNQ
ncbi:GNAT family N-acetyltransferase [Ferdinandcohnia quinoae]|uniref:GNAT family N-acetyltransferase n=1 Tax=Fredinandcohnia quinoae TaxID=2918902 RepID=A0AAW5E0E3_9BACI|nr:GNAT family N-acetyltransferase [Fredinandcohnia sp. SECRCQ15]